MASTIVDQVRAVATLVLPLGLRQWLQP